MEFNPVALGYGIITADAATLYVDQAKVTDAIRADLKNAGVATAPYETCVADIKALAAAGKSLWVDPEKVSAALVAAAEEAANGIDADPSARAAKRAKTGEDDGKKDDRRVRGRVADSVSEGDQERRRDRRHGGGASARRRRDGVVLVLAGFSGCAGENTLRV